MSQLILVESLSPKEAGIIMESPEGGRDLFMSGLFMASNVKNGNSRVYPREEIENAVKFVNGCIEEGRSICGELNHPNNLSIDLERVSHVITEMWMEGDNAMGKAKILNTPMGNILRTLMESGVKVGVSSRGSGEVMEGVVRDFQFVTVDAVATPSAPGAYPNLVRESIENQKVLTLAEAVCHDKTAQKFLAKELRAFIDTMLKR
jgi:hypothetical protein